MGNDREPSFQHLERNAQNRTWVERTSQELLKATPDELIEYSISYFGQTHRFAAIRTCEKQIRFYELLQRLEEADSFLAALPTLWKLYDECASHES
ncbi:MAG: hypothetical protein WAV04_02725 [Candidatus Microsaccharimonas sp.]